MQDIAEKVHRGERLTTEEGLQLVESNDILLLGQMADEVCRRKQGDAVYYSTNLNINPTNVCVLTCEFCAFARRPGEEGGWTYSIDEIVNKVRQVIPHGLSEVHIVGGLHPKLKLDYFKGLIRQIKEVDPDLHVKAFTAVEIDFFAKLNRMTVEEVLKQLQQAGLDTMPGGGAEIFSERVRKLLCPTKMTGDEWLEVMRTAHQLGIRTNATMLYGHIETKEEIIEHLVALRELQDQTGGFNAFVPLAFHPEHTDMAHLPPTTGYEDVKIFAVSRLMLDNFDHIKGLWTYLGDKMAQVLLYFGVDDLGGTLLEERIVHMAGANVPDGLGEKALVQLIESVGRRPMRTDSSYKIRETMNELANDSDKSMLPSTITQNRTLTLGHSPDPDDAFLFYAMTSGKINTEGFSFQHVLQDIETLNQRALRDEMDITAISVHTYALVSDRYALLPYGASVGEKYGPILVAKKPLSLERLRSAKIASPGPKTTAQLVLMLCLQPEQVVFAPFDQIMGLILSGEVDAGVLIHEGQLTYAQQGLEKIVDFGQWWYDKTKLPLPLGVNVVSKRLPLATQKLIAILLGRSLTLALQNREEAIEYAMRFGRGLKKDLTDRFVGMYVNEYAQDLGERGRAAIETLFEEGKRLNLVPDDAKVEIITV